MEYNFTYITTFNIDFFYSYIFNLELPYTITNLNQRDMKYVTVVTDREITPTEQSDLNIFIQNYSDFNQDIIDMEKLQQCKVWGRKTIDKFELRNMRRKDQSLLGRQELADIMNEITDSSVFVCLLEGSLDTLAGILFGYPEETIGIKTWVAKAPETFEHTWSEDIVWLKGELLTFIQTL